MFSRRAFLLSASAALHAAALGAMLVIAGGPGPVILVDLASVDLVAGSEPTGSDGAPPSAPPVDHGSRPGRATARPAAPRAVAAPAAPSSMPAVTETPSAPPRFELSREAPSSDGVAPPASDQPAGAGEGAVERGAVAMRGGAASDAAGEGGALGPAGGGALLALAVPGDGRGGGVPAEYGPYLARFRQHIQDALVYPLAARRQRLSGTVELEVLVEPSGLIRSVRLVASSSHALLDDAAVDTVKELAPLPLPENLPRRPLRIRVPVVFRLR